METLLLLLKSVLLGIVEGLTEFLPVSSTGHLIIVENWLRFKDFTPQFVETYTYVIQLGAILAVVVLYRRRIFDTLVHFVPKAGAFRTSGLYFWLMVALACVPGLICELALGDLAETYLFNAVTVALALFAGGVWMIVAERRRRAAAAQKAEGTVSPWQALLVGTFQCLAIVPGMSRSAATIIGGWTVGLSTVAATEFSFFLAMPALVGISLLKIVKLGGLSGLGGGELMALGVGFAVSFVVALVVVRQFIEFLKHRPMRGFAIYRMVFAVCVLAAGYLGLFS